MKGARHALNNDEGAFSMTFEHLTARSTGYMATGLAVVLLTASVLTSPVSAQEKSVTIVLSDEPSTLDPCQSAFNAIGRVNLHNIVETFTVRAPGTGEVVPHLAESWEQVDDHTWRFKLREGVTFHDGSPFNAEAAKYSIDRSMSEDLTCGIRGKFGTDSPLDVTVVDDTTIEIKTEQPDPILPLRMTTQVAHSMALPADQNTRDAIGSGPYQVAEWQPGQRIVLDRFEDYWAELPEAERAEFQWRSESSVRSAMVQQSEADLAPNIAPQDVTDDFGTSYPNSESTRLNLDLLKAPLDDARIRAAVNYAIDREALRGTVLSADVIPATQLILPDINGYNPNLEVWPYDPEFARDLIDDAKADGVPVETEIEFVGRIGHFPGVLELQEAITAMLLDAGLNVRLQWYEAAQKNEMQAKPFNEDRPPQIIVDQHDNNKGDAVFTVFSKYHSDGSQAKTTDPYLDFLIERASSAAGDERTRLWQQVFSRIEDAIIADAMLFHMVGYAGVGDDINFEPNLETNSAVRISDITFN